MAMITTGGVVGIPGNGKLSNTSDSKNGYEMQATANKGTYIATYLIEGTVNISAYNKSEDINKIKQNKAFREKWDVKKLEKMPNGGYAISSVEKTSDVFLVMYSKNGLNFTKLNLYDDHIEFNNKPFACLMHLTQSEKDIFITPYTG